MKTPREEFEDALREYGDACTHRYEERVANFERKEHARYEQEMRAEVLRLYDEALAREHEDACNG